MNNQQPSKKNPPLTKEQRRKKRLRKKRMQAIALLLAFVLILFFAVKGIASLTGKNNHPHGEESSSDIQSQSQENSEDLDMLPEATPNAQSEDLAPTPTPVAEKPEQTWATTLVNVNNPLPADFTVDVRTIAGTEKKYDVRAADNLEQMLADARAAGYNMYLVSTYRTVAYQQGLFDRKINEYKNSGYDDATARAEAAKWVAIPGTSEHNLGLAADIVSSTWYNTNNDLTQDFENTEHFKWLYENCANYGFILRYPKGKESITGIVYEPWHYRFVGVEAAQYIMNNNLTLEEYHQ